MPDDILNKVISFISGDGDSGSDKDVLLKQLVKEISQNKYAKFYRARQEEVDSSLGQFFYSVYKLIYPLQVFLKDPAKEGRIKQIALEAFLDKRTMDLIKQLGPEGIAERKRNAGADLSKSLEEDLATLAAGFDNPKIATADKCYNLILSMKQFVSFKYGDLLSKFDPQITAGDFTNPPKLAPVDISIVSSDISSFLSVMPPLEGTEDWKSVFEILKYCKGGTDVIPLAQWTTLLASLKDIKYSKILDLIAKLASGNPILEVKANVPHETLSASWLEQKTAEVREVIAGIAGSQRSSKINLMEQEVFGSLPTTRLSFYTADKGRILLDKNLEEYTYAPALNHLLAFIEEFLSKEIQELCDILLVRGQWTNNTASRAMSDGFHVVVEVAKEIIQLDESLAEDANNGQRLRGALLRVDRDKSQVRHINSIISTVNEDALNILNKSVSSLIVVGKHFKMLMDDCEKKPFELIMNWKELNGVSRTPIVQRIGAAYKKVNYFVQLMQLETYQAEE